MSFDVHVQVHRGLTFAEINEGLAALEAPFAVGDFRLEASSDGSQPDWSQPFRDGAYRAYPLLPELSFEAVGEAGVEFDGNEYEMMAGSAGFDREIVVAVALVMARCRPGATIFLSKTGETHEGKLTKLEREVTKSFARIWRDLEARAARVPEEIAAYRRPRPEDTPWAHYERVALREAPEGDVARYLRERAALAMAAGNDGEIERLLAVSPPGLAPLEPLLDACARADRADLGRRVLSAFRPHAGEHFLASVGQVGLWAVPYVRFLAGLGEIALDAELLREARSRANDAEMCALIESLAARQSAG